MTIYDPIQITFLIQDDSLYQKLIQELDELESNSKTRRFPNFEEWQNQEKDKNLPEVLVMDYNPDTGLGIDTLGFFKERTHDTYIILVVSRENVSRAIDTLKEGVEDYITHYAPAKLFSSIKKILTKIEDQRSLIDQQKVLRRIEKKNIALLNAQPDYMLQVARDGLILDYKPSGESKALMELFEGDEIQGQELGNYFDRETTATMLEIINRVMDNNEPEELEFKMNTQGVIHKMEARFVKLTYLECLLIIREFQGDIEREEEYYRAISRISRYRHKENLVKELLTHMVNSDKNLLTEEKKKADLLLSNILPSYMIEDLKKTGKVQPVQYDNASVMFTDFVGFSKISKYMSPTQLLKELTIYFDEFERICENYGIEKVKTIGDSFLCVSGLGKKHKTAILDSILAGIEMTEFTYNRKKELEKSGESGWGIRISIHSGALIAGVVGHKKIAFDIWGHTVNIASRIEAVGASGKITVSRSVFDGARDFFDFDYAGEKELKGVGFHDLYTVGSLKQGLYNKSEGNSLKPNHNFKKLYKALCEGKHILYTEGKYKIHNHRVSLGNETQKAELTRIA